jgi:alginate O-acetyltransferase complex protein AlgI
MHPFVLFFLLGFFILIEWFGRKEQYAIGATLSSQPRFLRWLFYALLIFMLGVFAQTNETPFIYFQF